MGFGSAAGEAASAGFGSVGFVSAAAGAVVAAAGAGSVEAGVAASFGGSAAVGGDWAVVAGAAVDISNKRKQANLAVGTDQKR